MSRHSKQEQAAVEAERNLKSARKAVYAAVEWYEVAAIAYGKRLAELRLAIEKQSPR